MKVKYTHQGNEDRASTVSSLDECVPGWQRCAFEMLLQVPDFVRISAFSSGDHQWTAQKLPDEPPQP